MAEPGKPTRRYRGISPQARVQQRRTRLIEAGFEVFGEVGVSQATVKQICAAAGLTERYFYESFKNQAELFVAVYEAGIEEIQANILKALEDAVPQPLTLTHAAMTAFFETLKAQPRLARVVLVEVYGSTEDLQHLYTRGVSDFASIARGLIDQHALLRDEPDLDPDLLSTAVIGAAIHLALRWYLEGFQQSVPTMVAHGSALLRAVVSPRG